MFKSGDLKRKKKKRKEKWKGYWKLYEMRLIFLLLAWIIKLKKFLSQHWKTTGFCKSSWTCACRDIWVRQGEE